MERPLDTLNKAKGTEVLVELKNGHELTGKLTAFDIHTNLVLENASEKTEKTSRKMKQVFIRGDMVVHISQTD